MKFERKLIIVTLSFLVGFSLIISFWLLHIQEEDYSVFKRLYLRRRHTGSLRNFIDNRGAKFRIKQLGQYWILYNYIVAKNFYVGNESVTLAVHGEYTDLETLNVLVRRWHGPISFTLFANGNDFQRAEGIILYMTKCTVFSSEIRSFVTFNIIMHEEHIWNRIPKSEKDFMTRTVNCMNSPFNLYNETYRQEKKLMYPSNMARNVARQTVSTYYVLSLDINYLPSVKFIEKFLQMVDKLHLGNPFNTVYTLTVFNAPTPKVLLPESKKELLGYYNKNILYSNEETRRTPNIKIWLKSLDKPKEFSILQTLKHEIYWFPWYVSVNDYEPFSDDRYHQESVIDRTSHIDLLEALGYDFAVIDNAFLLYVSPLDVSLNDSTFIQNVKNATSLEYHRKLIIFRDFLIKFM